MSDLTENEILDRHTQSLKECAQACRWLARNADPDLAMPRARYYKNLRQGLEVLEGTCRQLAAFRGDVRWTKLGFVYAKTMRFVQVKYRHQNWLWFRDLVQLFDNGIARMDELATRKTGTTGLILPKRTDWMQLPEVDPLSGNFKSMLKGTVH